MVKRKQIRDQLWREIELYFRAQPMHKIDDDLWHEIWKPLCKDVADDWGTDFEKNVRESIEDYNG